MNLGLVALAFRRTLSPFVIAAWVVLAVLFLSRDWSGETARLDASLSGSDPETLARGMARAGAWTALALVFAPLLVARAARTIPAWRTGEGEWLGSRPAGRGVVLLSTWLGTWLGALVLFLCTAIAIEARSGGSAPSLERAGAIALPGPQPSLRWIEPAAPFAWTAPDPGDAAPSSSGAAAPSSSGAAAPGRARVELGFATGAPAVEAVFRARRVRDGAPESVARARIVARGAIEVELPPGPGDLELEIACVGAGTRVAVASQSVELWTPCASERAASLRVFAILAVATCAWCGLAIGLAAWVSAPTAALALLAAWLAAWLAEIVPRWLPGADLWAAIATASGARVPPAPDPAGLAAAAALATLGLALGAAGLGRWRAT